MKKIIILCIVLGLFLVSTLFASTIAMKLKVTNNYGNAIEITPLRNSNWQLMQLNNSKIILKNQTKYFFTAPVWSKTNDVVFFNVKALSGVYLGTFAFEVQSMSKPNLYGNNYNKEIGIALKVSSDVGLLGMETVGLGNVNYINMSNFIYSKEPFGVLNINIS